MGAHAIAAQPLGVRQLQHPGEAAVIGEQQQPFGADVEAPDAHEARQARRQGVEDGRAPLRIGIGGHEAGRLVVEEQAGALAPRHRLAVDGDAVAAGDVHRRRGDRLAVDRDPAGGDPLLGVAARAQAGARHHLGDAVAMVGKRPCRTARPGGRDGQACCGGRRCCGSLRAVLASSSGALGKHPVDGSYPCRIGLRLESFAFEHDPAWKSAIFRDQAGSAPVGFSASGCHSTPRERAPIDRNCCAAKSVVMGHLRTLSWSVMGRPDLAPDRGPLIQDGATKLS